MCYLGFESSNFLCPYPVVTIEGCFQKTKEKG